MATVAINNSPIHDDSTLTAVYGDTGSMWSCGFHTGVDFVPYGTTVAQPDIYSVCDGTVVEVHASPSGALGCYVVVEDLNGDYWRYCHMVDGSIQVNLNDNVTTASIIGQMGATGNVTGIHLHLEYATTAYWSCSTFMNPCDYLQIPNERGTVVEYDGTIPPTPPTPPTPIRRGKFPWVLYAKKLRAKHILDKMSR